MYCYYKVSGSDVGCHDSGWVWIQKTKSINNLTYIINNNIYTCFNVRFIIFKSKLMVASLDFKLLKITVWAWFPPRKLFIHSCNGVASEISFGYFCIKNRFQKEESPLYFEENIIIKIVFLNKFETCGYLQILVCAMHLYSLTSLITAFYYNFSWKWMFPIMTNL